MMCCSRDVKVKYGQWLAYSDHGYNMLSIVMIWKREAEAR
jgi:hypothetical protein